MDGRVVGTLRAKYLDWCSARITERFLALEPEEIYEMARPTESAETGRPTSEGERSYRVLVQRVTESLLERMSLPGFEEWSVAYAADPARYDAELLGFREDPSGGGGA
ncbi:MAG TPA: hypothetical protein VMM12_18930 [Longimicrobiales bacterium]|nr:hypothetical protein [Longimicrobiales bacterium]